MKPAMTYREMQDSDPVFDSLLQDDRFAVEQKMDGTRVLVEIHRDGAMAFWQRNGKELKHTAATQHIPSLVEALQPLVHAAQEWQTRIVLDGELLTGEGTYHVFDLPAFDSVHGVPMADRPYMERRAALETLLQPVDRATVRAVASVTSESAKRHLHAAVRDAGAEGVMVKDVTAPYEFATRVRHTVKVKNVLEADVVVIRWDRGYNDAGREVGSALFGAYDEIGALVPLGSCSLIGKPAVSTGDVITVKYLFRQDGGALVQPRLVRVRPDKHSEECTFAQFRTYSRGVV